MVAVDGDTVVGHVQMSRGGSAPTPVVALGPIGVLPARQGQGIGAALVRAALEEATQRGERVVMLLGSPAFYRRFGFRARARLGAEEPVRRRGRGGSS